MLHRPRKLYRLSNSQKQSPLLRLRVAENSRNSFAHNFKTIRPIIPTWNVGSRITMHIDTFFERFISPGYLYQQLYISAKGYEPTAAAEFCYFLVQTASKEHSFQKFMNFANSFLHLKHHPTLICILNRNRDYFHCFSYVNSFEENHHFFMIFTSINHPVNSMLLTTLQSTSRNSQTWI